MGGWPTQAPVFPIPTTKGGPHPTPVLAKVGDHKSHPCSCLCSFSPYCIAGCPRPRSRGPHERVHVRGVVRGPPTKRFVLLKVERQVFVTGVESPRNDGSHRNQRQRRAVIPAWGATGVPSDRSSSLGWKAPGTMAVIGTSAKGAPSYQPGALPGSPVTGLRHWGGKPQESKSQFTQGLQARPIPYLKSR